MLVDAAWEDVATMMLQEQEQTFFAGFTQVLGERAICCTVSCQGEDLPRERGAKTIKSHSKLVYFLFQKMLDRDVLYHPRGPGTGHLQLTPFRGSYEPPAPPCIQLRTTKILKIQ